MTDHYALAVEALADAEALRHALRVEYETRPKSPIRIARLESAKRDAFTRAKLQSNLAAVTQARAQVQALEDLRGEIAALFQDLNATPGAWRASKSTGRFALTETGRRPGEVLLVG
jgi:hypothetical protein